MNFCSNCGAKVDPGSKFCTNCGARLEEVQNTVPSDQQVMQQVPNNQQEMQQVPNNQQVMQQVPNNVYQVPPTRSHNSFKNNDFVNKAVDWVKKNKIASVIAVVVLLVLCVGGYKYHQVHSSVLYGTEVTLNSDHTGYISSDSLFALDKKIAIVVAKKDGISNEIIKSISESDSADDLADKINDENENDTDDKIEKYTEDLEDLQNTDLTISPDTDLTPGKKVVLKFKDQETANKLKNEYGINVHPVTVKVKGQE